MVSKTFKTIALSSKSNDPDILDIATQCIEIFENKKINVCVTSELNELGVKYRQSKKNIIQTADLVVSIGGDGTMIDSAKNFGYFGIPILGINLGNLGFLTDIQPEKMSISILDILKGKYKEEERFFLQASVNKKKTAQIAVNEIVIHSNIIANLTKYKVEIDDALVYSQKADGLIVSTPTGSTAYSMSGGGPIVHPQVKSLTILPMFAHSVSTSPLIVSDNAVISIKMMDQNNPSEIFFDGHKKLTLKRGDVIKISRSEKKLKLIHPLDHNFFDGCRVKLGWAASISE